MKTFDFTKEQFLEWLEKTDKTATKPPSRGCPMTLFLREMTGDDRIRSGTLGYVIHHDDTVTDEFIPFPEWAIKVPKVFDDWAIGKESVPASDYRDWIKGAI